MKVFLALAFVQLAFASKPRVTLFYPNEGKLVESDQIMCLRFFEYCSWKINGISERFYYTKDRRPYALNLIDRIADMSVEEPIRVTKPYPTRGHAQGYQDMEMAIIFRTGSAYAYTCKSCLEARKGLADDELLQCPDCNGDGRQGYPVSQNKINHMIKPGTQCILRIQIPDYFQYSRICEDFYTHSTKSVYYPPTHGLTKEYEQNLDYLSPGGRSETETADFVKQKRDWNKKWEEFVAESRVTARNTLLSQMKKTVEKELTFAEIALYTRLTLEGVPIQAAKGWINSDVPATPELVSDMLWQLAPKHAKKLKDHAKKLKDLAEEDAEKQLRDAMGKSGYMLFKKEKLKNKQMDKAGAMLFEKNA